MNVNNRQEFRNELHSISGETLENVSDVEELYRKLYDNTYNVYNNCFPLCEKKTKNIIVAKTYIY